MKYCFDWNAQKEIRIAPGNYFDNIVVAGCAVYLDTAGRDEFLTAGVIRPGSRLAGFGRSKCYTNCPGAIHTAPSKPVPLDDNIAAITFNIHTDIILDQGTLAASLCLDMAAANKAAIHIPLNSPTVRIDWQSRGSFIVTILNCR